MGKVTLALPSAKNRRMIFVYGTLKKGHERGINLLDSTARLIFDDAYIQGGMYNLGRYPAVVPKSPGVTQGEVWEVSEKTIDVMDRIEGTPTYYVRNKVPLLASGHSSAKGWEVWAYFLPKERLPKNAVPMPVGNWPLHTKEKFAC